MTRYPTGPTFRASRSRRLGAAVMLVASFWIPVSAAAAQEEAATAASRDWSETAVDDLHFIRATLRENHPGPSDGENPWYREWYERGFTESIDLARRAEDRSGYFFAVRHYVFGFQDGHMGVLGESVALPDELPLRWPGFVVAYDEGAFTVSDASGEASLRPGDVLVSCDGSSADRLASESLAPFVALWTLRGARPRYAPFLFVDMANPFVQRPRSCVFDRDGQSIRVALQWQDVARESLASRLAAARQAAAPPIEVRSFGENGHWISVSTFDLSDDAAAEGLDAVVAELAGRRAALEADDAVIVVDVRGNTGGSSSQGARVANAIWGESYVGYVGRTRPAATGVDWRLSKDNAEFLRNRNLARYIERYGEEDRRTRNYAAFVARYDSALAVGETFLRVNFDAPEAQDGAAPDSPIRGRVFLLTDSFCASACLDFADLVLSIDGVTHLGRETSADAVYIDNRSAPLPSGLGRIGFSMKVYRDRPRGHNESYRPDIEWEGRMDDTAAIETWILGLAGN